MAAEQYFGIVNLDGHLDGVPAEVDVLVFVLEDRGSDL